MSIFNASRLLGKTVLITGASAGIGAVRRQCSLQSNQKSLTLHAPHHALPGYRHIICKGIDQAFGTRADYSCTQGGSNLILVARRGDQLEKVAEAARAAHKASGVQQGGTVATIQLDVSDRAQVAALWSKVPPDLRNVDILGAYPPFVHAVRSILACRRNLRRAQSTMQVPHMASITSAISWIAI